MSITRIVGMVVLGGCIQCGGETGLAPAIRVDAISSPAEGSTNTYRAGATISFIVFASHNLQGVRTCTLSSSGTSVIDNRISFINGTSYPVEVSNTSRGVGTITYQVPSPGEYRFSIRIRTDVSGGTSAQGQYDTGVIRFRN